MPSMEVDGSRNGGAGISARKGGDLPDYVIQERIDLQKEIFSLRQSLPDHITKRVKDSVLLAQKQEKDNGYLQAEQLQRVVASQLAKSKLKRHVEQFPKTVIFDEPTSTDGIADAPVVLTAKLSNGPGLVKEKRSESHAFVQLAVFHQHILRTFPEYFKKKLGQ